MNKRIMRTFTLVIALIITMTGNAIATSVDIDSDSSTEDYICNPIDGTLTSKIITVSGMSPGTHWIGVMTDNDGLHARLTGNGLILETESANTFAGDYRDVSDLGIQTFTLEVWGDNYGNIVIQDNEGNIETIQNRETNIETSQNRETNMNGNVYRWNARVGPYPVDIPEFSTLALPIATVLGLMFIISSRKKEE